MATSITTRAGKGSALTHAEVDANFTNLKTTADAAGVAASALSQFAATTSAQLAGIISDETGTGLLVFATSPTLVTPALGAATATTINGATITSGTLNGSVTGTNTGDQTVTGTAAEITLTGGAGATPTVSLPTALTFTGKTVTGGTFASPTLTTPALGTPASGTLTNATGLPVAGIVASTVTALGVGSVEIGHATDTTLARVSAGIASIEGSNVLMASNTATDAQVRAATTGNNLVTAALIETASAAVALTDGVTIAVDWDTGVNFTVTLAGNRTLSNATNGQVGTWRRVQVTQDATGSRTLALDTQYVTVGDAALTLTTAASSVDVLMVYCRSTTVFEVYVSLNVK